VELAHHLYFHSQAAAALRERLVELNSPSVADETAAPPALRVLMAELQCARSSAELVVGIHGVVTPALARFETEYSRSTDGLLDLPSVRLLRRIVDDLDNMIEWGARVRHAFLSGGHDQATLAAWATHVAELLARQGLFEGTRERSALAAAPPPLELRQTSEGPYRRPLACARDDRFAVFSHTRRYEGSDLEAAAPTADSYQSRRLEMIRIQRDELDAIETFANVLHDLPSAPFELELFLARLIWDEARHAEIGQQALAQVGYDPYAVPCGVVGINVRSPLPPEIAFAQIATFGELNQLKPLKIFAREARERGDLATARCFEFIHADELGHVRTGRRWLAVIAADSGRTVEKLQEEAREAAIRRLCEDGIIGEDYARAISDEEIADLVGE
jgi:hypothetical protein